MPLILLSCHRLLLSRPKSIISQTHSPPHPCPMAPLVNPESLWWWPLSVCGHGLLPVTVCPGDCSSCFTVTDLIHNPSQHPPHSPGRQGERARVLSCFFTRFSAWIVEGTAQHFVMFLRLLGHFLFNYYFPFFFMCVCLWGWGVSMWYLCFLYECVSRSWYQESFSIVLPVYSTEAEFLNKPRV